MRKRKEWIKSDLDFVGAKDEERATTGRPYKIKVKSAHRDNVQIARKYALFYDLFAYSAVGATTGRPPSQGNITRINGQFTHAESARDTERRYPERFLVLGICADFAPRVGARAACRAREGVGGSITKPTVQAKSAADPRPYRLPTADGTRRGAS